MPYTGVGTREKRARGEEALLGELEGRARRRLGTYLRRLRQASGWTLEDLVRIVERQGGRLSVSTLHRIECGKSALPLETISLVARSLGVALSEIDERLQALRGTAVSRPAVRDAEGALATARRLAGEGRFWDALACLDAVLEGDDAPARLDPDVEARVHLARSYCHRKLRHYELSLAAAGRVLRREGVSEEPVVQALLLHLEVHAMRGDFLRARVYAEHCRGRIEGLRTSARAYGWLTLGILEFKQERWGEALACFDRAQDLYRELGAALEMARAEVLRAECLHRTGRRHAGLRLVEQGRRRAEALRGWEVVVLARFYQGDMAVRDGARARAEACFRAARDVARRAGLTNDLFVAWYRLWEVGRAFADSSLERRARRVLLRMLRRVERRALPEAARLLEMIRPSDPPRRAEDDA